MKKTVSLQVAVSTAIERVHLVLHPNEGFDLGLMRVAHPVRLCHHLKVEDFLRGESGQSDMVSVDLLNECPPKTLLVGVALHRLLGGPTKAVLLFDGQRLFVHGS